MGIIAGIRFIPTYLYKKKLDKEISSFSREILKGEQLLLDKKDESVHTWKNFHFSHFILPLPIRHPSFRLTPLIHFKKNPSLGMEFIDPKKRSLLKFKIGRFVPFSSPLHKKKIFHSRVFREYMLKKTRKNIIEDLFSKDLLHIEKKPSYKELIYNLFILQMRKDLFPSNARKVYYLPWNQTGVITIDSPKKTRVDQIWYAFTGDGFKTISIQWKKNDRDAISFKKKIMKIFRYKKISLEKSKKYYEIYKSLPYKTKIDQEGLMYLLLAWSHEPKKQDYVREMIFYMEKGEKNFSILLPLYRYYRKSSKKSDSRKQ